MEPFLTLFFTLKDLKRLSLFEKWSYSLFVLLISLILWRLLNFKMSVNRRNRLKHGSNLRLVLLVLWLVCYVCYGQFEDTNDFNNPAVLPLVTQMVYRSLSNSTAALNQELATRAKFCVKDPYAFLCFACFVSLLLSNV